MRGYQNPQPSFFSYVDIEDRIPADHPLREIKKITDKALKQLHRTFNKLYSSTGRPSIPPEHLIKASLIQILFGIRSEIQLMQQTNYNLLFRWFIGLGLDDEVWTPESFSTNRDRLFNTDTTKEFFHAVLKDAEERKLTSKEHFSVDGTLLKAWASQKSFRPKDEESNSDTSGQDFRGEKRSNETHESKTDPDARLYKKSEGSAAELCYMGHVMMENRNGLAVECEVTVAETKQERECGLEMAKRHKEKTKQRRITLGGDKGYDVNDFIDKCRAEEITPHVAQRNDNRDSSLDARTTRHVGYDISINKRKMIEKIFGWIKSAGCVRQVKVRGIPRVDGLFRLVLSIYNIVRIQNLDFGAT
jgi:transposase